MSEWLEVAVNSDDDLGFAVDLVAVAATAHRPAPGVSPREPPTGAALARRRRFH